MHIKGLVKTSLLDYPGKIAAVVFTSGCNFRCPFCQNAHLILQPTSLPDIAAEEVLALLAKRRRFLDGVVISGGEPTLQTDLADFMSKIKKLELATKLDTNGYRPDVIASLLTDGLVDEVAMDIKAPLPRYPLAAGVPVDPSLITQSISLLLASNVSHEFRTTVVPGIVGPEDVAELAAMLQGAQRYALQQFRAEGVLDPAWESVSPYPAETLQEMAKQLCARGVPTIVRGI